MIWALVPLKKLSCAKQRLSSVLSPGQRSDLMQAMVRDVLDVLSDHPVVAQIVLVSDDPIAGELAERYNALWWQDSSFGLPPEALTLSSIIDAAGRRLGDQGVDTMLVVHGDLPQINQNEIQLLNDQHAALPRPALSIASDHRVQGINCILLSPPNAVPAQHEGYSFDRYLAAAKDHGVHASSACLPGFSRDIDSPNDLHCARQDLGPRGHTHRYLTQQSEVCKQC